MDALQVAEDAIRKMRLKGVGERTFTTRTYHYSESSFDQVCLDYFTNLISKQINQFIFTKVDFTLTVGT